MGRALPILLACLGLSCAQVERTVGEVVGDDAPEEHVQDGPVWTYVNSEGRHVFVGAENMVPPEYREDAHPMDVSNVDLHHDLGREWDAAVEREHERLSETPYCEEAIEEASEGVVGTALGKYGYLIAIGILALLLVLTAPWIGKHVGFPRWSRVLMFVLPLLAFIALLTTVVVQSSDAMAQARQAADLCTPELIDSSTEGGRIERMNVVQQLTQKVRAAHAARDRFISDQMEYETRGR